MEKAYDLKALVVELKGQGVEVAEAGAKGVVEAVFNWVHASASLSTNPFDDLVDAAVLPKLKDLVLAKVDKIDGQVG